MILVKTISSIVRNEHNLHGFNNISKAVHCVSYAVYNDLTYNIDSLTIVLMLSLVSDFLIISIGLLYGLVPQL
ncbi:hypothetical protein YKV028 [Yokapox virus]|uniref:Uncharacterized protein n=1 Tax=Yokapox virus TaxID=1076255 RepID=G3EIA6_9POXV|nr:hypothetical protein YKV028 [Yokapox virus]AEN03617.1 hypothetical protein YKV028 [Yokapox virus]